jgi:plastin-1
MQLFDECRDGLILSKLINASVPDTIDTRVLNKPTARNKALNAFQMTENNNLVIQSAKAIGCSVVNIGSSDIAEGREHLILGLIWQIIRRGLLAQIDIKLHPELYRLCEEGETIDDLLRLTPDQILLRWFNYHLKAAGWRRRCVLILQVEYACKNGSLILFRTESTTSVVMSMTERITRSC